MEIGGVLVFNKVSIVVLIATIIVFLIAIYASILQVFGIDNANKATIIGGILSMIGGALGALGAYLVARNQIEKEKKIGEINRLSKELPVYINLSLELEKIIAQLQAIEEKKESIGYQLAFEKNGGFRELDIKFDALEWNRWNNINYLSDSILLIELLKFQESFKRMSDVFEYDISQNSLPLNNLNNVNNHEYLHLKTKIDSILIEKEMYYKELPYCLQKAIKIYNVIQTKSSQIEKILEGQIDIESFKTFTPTNDFMIDRET